MRALLLTAAVAMSQSVLATPKLGDGTSSHPLMTPGYAVEYLLGVVLVMVALGVFAVLLRRLQGRVGGGQEGLRMRASLPLGGKERLVVVQVQDETLLLGVSPGCVQLVSKLASTQMAQEPAATGDSWLSRTLSKNLNNPTTRNTSGGSK